MIICYDKIKNHRKKSFYIYRRIMDAYKKNMQRHLVNALCIEF